jgi:hypothetical protein
LASVLREWLTPHDLDWFREHHFDKAPCSRAGTAIDAVPLFGWPTLESILARPECLDLLTVARGRLVDAPVPRSVADVRRLFGAGISVVIRASERHDLQLRSLADAFGEAVPGEVHVQLYATPAGTNSYGWHYDFEHVFIAQTAGAKEYYFRANTVARDTELGDPLDFTPVTREASPLLAAHLVAGDWLYLPSRWWHLVKCVEDALSISVGVMSPATLACARRLPAGWSGRR